MKYLNKFMFIIICALCFSKSPCQVSVNLNTGDFTSDPAIDVAQSILDGSLCANVTYDDSDGNSSSSLGISFSPIIPQLPSLEEALVNLATNGTPVSIPTSWKDLLPGLDQIKISTSANIGRVSGAVESYLVGSSPLFGPPITLEKEISGNVNYTDMLEVVSNTNTTIELPLTVSASFVTGQTFADTDNSEGRASATITGSLGGTSISVGKTFSRTGANLTLVETDDVSETVIVSVAVSAGVNNIPLQVTGTLSAYSKLTPLSLVPAAINTGANAGNSIIIGHFTGPNGSPLPPDIQIVGLNTNIPYSDYSRGTPIDCPFNLNETRDFTINNFDVVKAENQLVSTSTVEANVAVAFTSGGEVILSPNFHAKKGAKFSAQINACNPTSAINVKEEKLSSYEQSLGDVKIYPNPLRQGDELNIRLPMGVSQRLEAFIIDAKGMVVANRIINASLGDQVFVYDTNLLKHGVYYLQLVGDLNYNTIKLVIVP
ncbi:MAG: 3-coathanger stack domain-containing protein [Bacteroidota bacterium]